MKIIFILKDLERLWTYEFFILSNFPKWVHFIKNRWLWDLNDFDIRRKIGDFLVWLIWVNKYYRLKRSLINNGINELTQ